MPKCWDCKKNKKKEEFYKRQRTYNQCINCDKKYKKTRYQYIRKRLIKFLGNKCKICGESEYILLDLDHIKGGGRKERIVLGGSSRLMRFYSYNLAKAKGHLQILCVVCHRYKNYRE